MKKTLFIVLATLALVSCGFGGKKAEAPAIDSCAIDTCMGDTVAVDSVAVFTVCD